MGDVIYPGIVLHRLPGDVTTKDIKKYVYQVIGKDPHLFEGGEPKAKIYHRVGRKPIVIISGIRKPFDWIRKRFGSNMMRINAKKVLVFVYGPDFGIPRNDDENDENYGQLDQHNKLLHEKLKHANGFLPILNIFNNYFNDLLVNVDKLTSTIVLNEKKENVDWKKLIMEGEIVTYSKCANPGGNFEEQGFCNLELDYQYTLEALQVITKYNKNSSVINDGKCKSFVMNGNGEECKITKNFGMGPSGSTLNVKKTIEEYKYIPWEFFYMDVIDDAKMKKLMMECEFCCAKVKILGISANLNYFACECKCLPTGTIFAWPEETFYRMVVPLDKRTVLKDPWDVVTKGDLLVRFIQPVCSIFDSVEHFKSTVGAAWNMELLEQKRVLHHFQTNGVVTAADFVEVVPRGDKYFDKWAVIFSVEKDKLWDEDGLAKMRGISFMPLTPNLEKEPASFVAANDKKCLGGKVHSITEDGHDKTKVNVSVNIFISSGLERKVVKDEQFRLIPKPPTSEKIGVKRIVSKWLEYEASRKKNCNFLTGLIYEAAICGQEIWNPALPPFNVWKLRVAYDNTNQFVNIFDLLKRAYIGLEATFKITIDGNLETVSETARVVGAFEEQIPSKVIILDMIVILNSKIEVTAGCSVKSEFWVVLRSQSPFEKVEEQKNYLPGSFSDDDVSDDDQEDYDEDDGYDADLEGSHMKKNVKKEELLDGFQTFIDENLDSGESDNYDNEERDVLGNLKDILSCWRLKPGLKYQSLNLLLKQSTHNILKNNICDFFDFIDVPLTPKLSQVMQKLNPSQHLAVTKFMSNPLTLTHGPPGCGKTLTIACGIAALYLTEAGLVLANCASNYASDVLLNALEVINKKFKLKMKIVRVLTTSLEKKETKKGTSSFLHDMITNHYQWKGDEKLKEIETKEQLLGPAKLKKDEEDYKTTFTKRLTNKILRNAHVVVCTLATGGDSRLESFVVNVMQKRNREISGVIIDEASLVPVISLLQVLPLGPKRVWFAGDYCQLNPAVSSASAQIAALDVSAMEFMMMSDFVKNNNAFSMLDIQYRMAVPIATLVSNFMYNGKVKSDASVIRRIYDGGKTLPEFPELRETNLGVYTYCGYVEKMEFEGASLFNETEIAITLNIVNRLKLCGVALEKISVIVMYEAHRELMRKQFDALGHDYKSLEIATVDSYQGREQQYVIVNIVRSNKTGNFHNVGFLKNPRRMNISLSRTKHYIFLVCDIKTLVCSRVPDMERLFNFIVEMGIKAQKFTITNGIAHKDKDDFKLKDFMNKMSRYKK